MRVGPVLRREGAGGFALVIASLVLSLGGVAIAVCSTTDPADGGRGGALAVAVTLVAFFLRKDLDGQLRKAFTETLPQLEKAIGELSDPPRMENDSADPTQQIASLQRIVTAMETSNRLSATSERRMDRAVAVAAAIGTLVWGFGDVAAGWMLS